MIVRDPDATGVTVPMPLSIEPLVAFVEVQESVALWPWVIVEGVAVRVQVGGVEALVAFHMLRP